MTTDNGGAPCTYRGLLSLAICKPALRRVARKEALVFGFGSKAMGERLVYIARITERLEDGVYNTDSQYATRPDCIYRWDGRKYCRKPTAQFHSNPNDIKKDLGKGPKYGNAVVLISSDFRYFGREECSVLNQYPRIKRIVRRLTQGHRAHLPKRLYADLIQLKIQVWEQYSTRKAIGKPTHVPDAKEKCRHTSGPIIKINCC